jgi:adenylate kinase/nucleoside 2-deoxyribosyltransferase
MQKQKWIVTGISGSDRIELLNDLANYSAKELSKTVRVHDVGKLIAEACQKSGRTMVDKKILDVDRSFLASLRSTALKDVKIAMLEEPSVDLHLIGIHATFRWRNRLIPGISFNDVLSLDPNGFINIHRDVEEIIAKNQQNDKWESENVPNAQSTQEWMMEEEFVTEVLAEVTGKPIIIVSRKHKLKNLADFFFSNKRKVYLSYPITPVRESNPELLEEIQGKILEQLETYFIVFNPLTIQDMPLTYDDTKSEVPDLVGQLTPEVKEIIKKRTIERDFQFIDQSDAVIVFYLTDKLSPGVLAEIYYAHRNMKPVFLVLSGKRSPFIEDAADVIVQKIDDIMPYLKRFSETGKWA